MITVILPVRALEGAKARLSGVLNPAERRRLFTAMLQDVLRQVLRHPQLKPALVVTSDAETRCFAKRMGADVLAEPDEKGLSASVAHAQRISCLADGSDCLFIPGDVPLVTGAGSGRAVGRQGATGPGDCAGEGPGRHQWSSGACRAALPLRFRCGQLPAPSATGQGGRTEHRRTQ